MERKQGITLKKLILCLIACCVVVISNAWAEDVGKPEVPGEEGGLLGSSLPADFRPFDPTSPWNTPIPSNPPIDPYSEMIIARLKHECHHLIGSFTVWTTPLFVIDASRSLKATVFIQGNCVNPILDPYETRVIQGIPIPEGVWPDPSKDGHMLLVDPKLRRSWSFTQARQLSRTTWSVYGINTWDLNGMGYRSPFLGRLSCSDGSRGSGFPLIAGLIRPEEIEAGRIRHALVFASPINQKGIFCSPPASTTDGWREGADFIPEGARLQLDPNVDLDSLGLSPAAKVVARALQEYGMFCGDNSKAFKLYFQNLGSKGSIWETKYHYIPDLGKIPIDRFRVIQCQRVRTP